MTTINYMPNTPFNQKASIGQGQIDFNINFQTLYTAFAQNHVALDAGSQAGDHKVIELPEQTAVFQTDSGEISCYCRNTGAEGEQIYLRYENNATEFQLTPYQIYSLVNTSSREQYFTFVPGKVIIYFGKINLSLNPISNSTLTLDPGIASNIISVNFCPVFNNTAAFPPIVTIPTPNPQGKYTAINMRSSVGFQFTGDLYYVVAANL